MNGYETIQQLCNSLTIDNRITRSQSAQTYGKLCLRVFSRREFKS